MTEAVCPEQIRNRPIRVRVIGWQGSWWQGRVGSGHCTLYSPSASTPHRLLIPRRDDSVSTPATPGSACITSETDPRRPSKRSRARTHSQPSLQTHRPPSVTGGIEIGLGHGQGNKPPSKTDSNQRNKCHTIGMTHETSTHGKN